MPEDGAKGTNTSDPIRLKRLDVISAVVVAIIGASSGWLAFFWSNTKTADVDTPAHSENVGGHWEISANGYVFDMCITQDSSMNIAGFMFLRGDQREPFSPPCKPTQKSTDPFRGLYNPKTGQISFTRDPDTDEAQNYRGTVIKLDTGILGQGIFNYTRNPGETATFMMMYLQA